MKTEVIAYSCNGKNCLGYFVGDRTSSEKRPCILIGHAWLGQNEFAKEMAHRFFEMGYYAFALDFYGEGFIAGSREEAKKRMSPLVEDPIHIHQNIEAAIGCVRSFSQVSSVAFVGFCFGGTCAVEAVKADLDLEAAVSVHGILGNYFQIPIKDRGCKKSKIPLLILHGDQDSMVLDEHIVELKELMNKNQIDWQMITFSQTMHAFTNPAIHVPQSGLAYNEKSAKRSFVYIKAFLKEVFDARA